MDNWISVEDKLPINEAEMEGYYMEVDVITFDGVSVDFNSFQAGKMPNYWSCFTSYTVTHWMPLPLPPKAGE
jgi:hypothetical protein